VEAEAVKTRRAQYEGNLVIATHLTRSTEDIDGSREVVVRLRMIVTHLSNVNVPTMSPHT